ncbi:50S ribosomal protein L11 methyltransferase [Alishewanella longhuensis]
MLNPVGLLALSGILQSQAQSVIDAYATEFVFDAIAEQEEWVRLSARKNT